MGSDKSYIRLGNVLYQEELKQILKAQGFFSPNDSQFLPHPLPDKYPTQHPDEKRYDELTSKCSEDALSPKELTELVKLRERGVGGLRPVELPLPIAILEGNTFGLVNADIPELSIYQDRIRAIFKLFQKQITGLNQDYQHGLDKIVRELSPV